jgi:multimeric flavodoxin WrbA
MKINRPIIKADSIKLFKNVLSACKNEYAIYELIRVYSKKINAVVIHLNQAWVAGSGVRMQENDYSNCIYRGYINLSDKEYIDKMYTKYPKRNIIFIQSNFYGLVKLCIV